MIKSQTLCHSKLSLHVTETDLGSVNFGECNIFIYLQYVFIIKSIKLTIKKKGNKCLFYSSLPYFMLFDVYNNSLKYFISPFSKRN